MEKVTSEETGSSENIGHKAKATEEATSSTCILRGFRKPHTPRTRAEPREK